MNKSEERLQSDCYVWFHNTYPEYRRLLCYNLNNSRDKHEAAKNRAMGLQKGRSDLVFYFNKKAYMIEMKVDSGRQSRDQVEWQEAIEEQGFIYHIVRNENAFKTLINNIIKYG